MERATPAGERMVPFWGAGGIPVQKEDDEEKEKIHIFIIKKFINSCETITPVFAPCAIILTAGFLSS